MSCDNHGQQVRPGQGGAPGTQITGATATLSTTSNQWEVNADAQQRGRRGLRQADLGPGQQVPSQCLGTNEDDYYLDKIAIVLDGNVVSSPETDGPIPGGNAQITGSFTQDQATQLQNVLKYGSLPLNFTILSTSSRYRPQLGRAQLVGGLIAAAIGLGLVVIYSFLYYRGLGIVSVSSLVIAGGLAYAGRGPAHQVPELHARACPGSPA